MRWATMTVLEKRYISAVHVLLTMRNGGEDSQPPRSKNLTPITSNSCGLVLQTAKVSPHSVEAMNSRR